MVEIDKNFPKNGRLGINELCWSIRRGYLRIFEPHDSVWVEKKMIERDSSDFYTKMDFM